MVRSPLTPQQRAAGKRLGAHLRQARGDRKLVEVAEAASISPETLRKIESGRLATPAFATVAALAVVLRIPLDDLARTCLPEPDAQLTSATNTAMLRA
ncbi:DNA-binding protein [Mycobacterium sp. IS-1742]|uniref:helix-turn-helix domain-containing protein n=1 Tax=Mycobacterium sp. IS-1742 TaxID=1772285 RepID=UPI0007400533|nr:helix-turn-helix transcriptional regulator [Mycobacterium sp. IS-1742]KUI29520.1 DNA-binding protein [Mycobacterium sp. IS-1742]